MAVRFDNDGESYTRSTGLTTVTNWSFCCWVKLAVDRAATTAILQIDNGSGTNKLRLTAWNGTALAFQTDGGGWFGTIGHTLVVGTWTFVGLSGTSNPGQARSAVRAAGSTTFAGGSPTQADVTFNAATLRIGDGQAASEWLNGSVAAVKVWDQALTFEELQQESWTYQPKRTAGLRGWYPLITAFTTDLSGAGQTLSGGSGAAIDDPPPITWSAGRRRIFIPSAASVDATLAATLPAVTAAATADVTVEGVLAAALPPIGAAFTATVEAAATLDATLPPLQAALAGTVEANVLEAVLPAVQTSITADVTVTGVLNATLPPITAAITAKSRIPANDATFETSGPARGWAAGTPDNGWDAGVARAWAARPPTT